MPVHLCCFGPPKGRRAEGAAAASLSACEYIIFESRVCGKREGITFEAVLSCLMNHMKKTGLLHWPISAAARFEFIYTIKSIADFIAAVTMQSPVPPAGEEWESRGTSPSGAVRAGPPAAQAKQTASSVFTNIARLTVRDFRW